jgi:hypothetical protein
VRLTNRRSRKKSCTEVNPSNPVKHPHEPVSPCAILHRLYAVNTEKRQRQPTNAVLRTAENTNPIGKAISTAINIPESGTMRARGTKGTVSKTPQNSSICKIFVQAATERTIATTKRQIELYKFPDRVPNSLSSNRRFGYDIFWSATLDASCCIY